MTAPDVKERSEDPKHSEPSSRRAVPARPSGAAAAPSAGRARQLQPRPRPAGKAPGGLSYPDPAQGRLSLAQTRLREGSALPRPDSGKAQPYPDPARGRLPGLTPSPGAATAQPATVAYKESAHKNMDFGKRSNWTSKCELELQQPGEKILQRI